MDIEVRYGVVFLNKPRYWFEDGRIHCDVGSSIGYDEGPMTKEEAVFLAASGGIFLSDKPITQPAPSPTSEGSAE